MPTLTAGGCEDRSPTSTRGWLRVPRTRTVIGGSPCRIAFVTSSETPSSAASTRSSRCRPMSTSQTQSRAFLTDAGSASSGIASRLSGIAHTLARAALSPTSRVTTIAM